MTTPIESSGRAARNLRLMKKGDDAFNRHDRSRNGCPGIPRS
jgi:hypothetical protein